MVISRTPFRISFFGGGTDLPKWYNNHEGMVISTTIDKYCFLSVKELPPFLPYKYRIVYSQQELVNSLYEIDHPSARECLRHMGMKDRRIEVVHSGDLPSKAGLGSSSSFTVGLLNALAALQNETFSKKNLAKVSIELEQKILKEAVGSQDQVAATYGGFNVIRFKKGSIVVSKLEYNPELKNFLLLYFNGTTRVANEIEKTKIKTMNKREESYKALFDIAKVAKPFFSQDVTKIGKLLNETWLMKKELSSKVSTDDIDKIYDVALGAGATGGKLLGSGGGGFLLFFVEPNKQQKVRLALKNLMEVPFQFESTGSTIIYNNSEH
jgi:D-glycero-alpha-D-manno-heptose-7-phosphate kinase